MNVNKEKLMIIFSWNCEKKWDAVRKYDLEINFFKIKSNMNMIREKIYGKNMYIIRMWNSENNQKFVYISSLISTALTFIIII